MTTTKQIRRAIESELAQLPKDAAGALLSELFITKFPQLLSLKPTRVVSEGRVLEWSRNCTWVHPLDPAVPRATPRRLFVVIDDTSTLIELVECDVTSERDTCQQLESGDRDCLSLTSEEAVWMIGALQAALAEHRRRWPEGSDG